ncbi:MAG: heme ABC exporter ATP-binding protein CcmA [Pseudomonadota bacterium]
MTVDQLAGGRAGTLVFAGISFTLAPGEAIVLRGANGCGKSTLLRTLAGLLRPFDGQINFSPQTTEGNLEIPAQMTVLVGHTNGLKATMTVRESINYWMRLYEAAEGADKQAIDRLRLGDLLSRRTSTLSAGQKRRLGLSRLLICNRPIWLMDEPTSSLDTATSTMVLDMMDTHLDAGGAIVAATHEPLELARAEKFVLEAA